MVDTPSERPEYSRRKYLQGAAGASAVGLTGYVTQDSSVQGRNSFQYGNDKSFVGSTDIPFLWSMWERLPQKWGYTGEINLFEGMGPLTQAMRAGAIDVGSSSIVQPANLRNAGFDVKLFGVETAGSDYVAVINTDLASDWSDFVGNNAAGWGYSGAGGNSHLQPAAVFRDQGYSLDNVRWRRIGDSSTRTAALAGGNLAGAAIHWNQWQRIKDNAPVESLGLFLDHLEGGWIDGGVYAPTSWLEQNRTTAVDLVASGRLAFEHVDQFEWYWNTWQEHKQSDMTKQEVRSSWEKFNGQFGSWPLPKPLKEDAVTTIIETAKEAGVLPSNYNTQEFYTMDIQEEALSRIENGGGTTTGNTTSN